MLPFFFAALPPTAKFHDLDGTPLIECVRSLTESTGPIDLGEKTGDLRWPCLEGPASKLNYGIVNSHAASLFGFTEKVVPECSSAEKGFATSWCSIAITSGLYLHGILGLWNAGKPIDRRLFRLLMTILVRDLDRTRNESSGRSLSDLWFWEHFVGAYSLAWHQSHAYDETLQAIESYFDSSIRSWSHACNVTQWEAAQQRLLKVAWPSSEPQILAERVWGGHFGSNNVQANPRSGRDVSPARLVTSNAMSENQLASAAKRQEFHAAVSYTRQSTRKRKPNAPLLAWYRYVHARRRESAVTCLLRRISPLPPVQLLFPFPSRMGEESPGDWILKPGGRCRSREQLLRDGIVGFAAMLPL